MDIWPGLASRLSATAPLYLFLAVGPAGWLPGSHTTAQPVRVGALAQERTASPTFSVRARKYTFDPSRLEVMQDDIVKVVFRAEDIPHSFTIDTYRISKRAAAGGSVTFEFRADTPGTFPFYCDLRIDDGCRNMRGELVVTPRR